MATNANLDLIARFKTIIDPYAAGVTTTQWHLGVIGRHLDELADLDPSAHEWFTDFITDEVDLTNAKHVAVIYNEVCKAVMKSKGFKM